MEMVILGAGGLGREVRDVIVALNDLHDPTQNDHKDGSAAGTTNVEFLGFIADGHPDVELLERLPAAHLGGLDQLHRFAGAGFVAAVGDPALRMRMAHAAEEAGLRPTTLSTPPPPSARMYTSA